MSETITISEEARKAADFLQPIDSRFGRDYVEQTIQSAINSANRFQVEAFFIGMSDAAGKPVGSFKNGGEWIDYIKGELAEKEKEIAELRRQIGTDFMAGVVIEHEKRIAEARKIIEHVGWTSSERPDVIKAAEKWLEGKP